MILGNVVHILILPLCPRDLCKGPKVDVLHECFEDLMEYITQRNSNIEIYRVM
jgi:hypothetical protein